MKDSAERMMRANFDLHNAQTEEERQKAITDYLDAERDHFKKKGVAQASPFQSAAIVVLVILIGVSVYFAAQNAGDTRDLIEQNQVDDYEVCLRGNDSRPVTLKNYRNDVEGLQADLDNLRADMAYLHETGLDGSSALLIAKRDAINAKKKQIRRKKKAIAGLIASVAPTAVNPGSVRVVCTPP